MNFRTIKQRIKSIINWNQTYYITRDRDEEVIAFTNGRKSMIEYWDFIDLMVESVEEESMKITKEQFEDMAKGGNLKVIAKLNKIKDMGICFSREEEMVDIECTIGKYWQGGYSYKVHLLHDRDDVEHRDIYTSTLVSFINDGTFSIVE